MNPGSLSFTVLILARETLCNQYLRLAIRVMQVAYRREPDVPGGAPVLDPTSGKPVPKNQGELLKLFRCTPQYFLRKERHYSFGCLEPLCEFARHEGRTKTPVTLSYMWHEESDAVQNLTRRALMAAYSPRELEHEDGDDDAPAKPKEACRFEVGDIVKVIKKGSSKLGCRATVVDAHWKKRLVKVTWLFDKKDDDADNDDNGESASPRKAKLSFA